MSSVTLTIFSGHGQAFYGMSLSVDMSNVFSWLELCCAFWEEQHRPDLLSQPVIGGTRC